MGNESAAQAGIGRYQDGTYLAKNPRWHSERADWKARQVASALKPYTGLRRICDIGCGTGDMLAELSDLLPSIEMVGYEPAETAPISAAASLKGIRIERANASNISERFDAALMLDVFEHVRDYQGFLEDHRKLAPLFIFHIPLDISALGAVVDTPASARHGLGHINYFTRKVALDSLTEAGYSIQAWRFTAAAFDGRSDARQRRPVNIARRILWRLSPEWTSRLLGGASLLVTAKTT